MNDKWPVKRVYADVRIDHSRRDLVKLGGVLLASAVLSPGGATAQVGGAGKMKIGVIGSGHIGGTVGGLWVKAGHPALISSRHPEELKDLASH
jgi:8-hydroxy-5-deazaflavin:NADPH oxidoreductase